MKRLLLLSSLLLTLSACGAPTVEDLIEDPETLAEISQKCQLMTMQGKDANTEECNNAKKAATQMMKNMMKGMGKDISNAMKKGFKR